MVQGEHKMLSNGSGIKFSSHYNSLISPLDFVSNWQLTVLASYQPLLTAMAYLCFWKCHNFSQVNPSISWIFAKRQVPLFSIGRPCLQITKQSWLVYPMKKVPMKWKIIAAYLKGFLKIEKNGIFLFGKSIFVVFGILMFLYYSN